MRLALLGAPGSGKGTQGSALARHFGVPHISSGELLRAEIAAGTDIGREVASWTDIGDLVPDETILAVVATAIAASHADGYILDGFPRTITQAERAYTAKPPGGFPLDAVVHLALTDDIARQRLAGRLRTGRADDAHPEAIERRLELYNELTRPLLDFYEGRDLLVTVDATQPVDKVTAAIVHALDERSHFMCP